MLKIILLSALIIFSSVAPTFGERQLGQWLCSAVAHKPWAIDEATLESFSRTSDLGHRDEVSRVIGTGNADFFDGSETVHKIWSDSYKSKFRFENDPRVLWTFSKALINCR